MLALMEPTQSAVRVKSAKAALRAAVLADLDASDQAAGEAVAALLLRLPEVAGAGCVAAYASMGREVDTRPFLDSLVAKGVRVLLPVLRPDGSLDWGVYSAWADLVSGLRGTREPAGASAALREANAVVVPAVA